MAGGRVPTQGLAWVTGGSSGIGLAFAELLSRQGWSLVLIARDAARLESARVRLQACGARAVQAQVLDVCDEAAVAATTRTLLTAHGTPDVVLLSAGVAEPGYFSELTPACHRQHMEINYFGSLWVARAVVEAMAVRGSGSLVFVSSAAGLVGVYGYGAYSPGKFAVRGLAEVLHAEYRRRGVHVGVVYPPDTDTPMLAAEADTRPVETARIAGAGGLWSASDVARAAWHGIRRRRFTIAPGFEVGLLARLHSLLLPLLQRWMDRLAHREAAAPAGQEKGKG